MLITFTCHTDRAPEVGHLLGKNPASVFEREFSGGTVWVFAPDVADDHLTVAMVTEIDAVGLVRGPTTFTGLDGYVNDRPYVANSLTSVALNVAFRTAMSGESKALPERVGERMRWEVHVPAVACDGGERLIADLFEPLGYTVACARLPLDPRFPAWGMSDVYDVRLAGEQTTAAVFNHLYVMLPVLDNAKHYYVAESEAEKLVHRGGDWLRTHPARDLIARRYLRYRRPLVTSALAQLRDPDGTPAEEEQEAGAEIGLPEPVGLAQPSDAAVPTAGVALEAVPAAAAHEAHQAHESGLHEQRLQAVMAAVRAVNATSLADLGCGEGRLLALALAERGLTRILGLDVSTRALTLAGRRLRLDDLAPAKRARIQIAQGSVLYRDARLRGFDVLAMVEVIEHLDPPRLGAMERIIFEHARPRRVVVTTPNREYNVVWEKLAPDALRHADHRFEWTRAECQSWAERVAATFGYTARREDIGPVEEGIGAPSQMVILDRAAPMAEERETAENADADGEEEAEK
jgi:3' terminal RNA ribose 2'-O-methyltransferase Hen1